MAEQDANNTPTGVPKSQRDIAARRYAAAMKSGLLMILKDKHPQLHAELELLPNNEVVDRLWELPPVRPMLTDMMLFDLGFYIGARVQKSGAMDGEYELTSIRVSHGKNGAPEFIQLYGESLDSDAEEQRKEPHYLGHIYEFVSLETMETVMTPEELGLSQP